MQKTTIPKNIAMKITSFNAELVQCRKKGFTNATENKFSKKE